MERRELRSVRKRKRKEVDKRERSRSSRNIIVTMKVQ